MIHLEGITKSFGSLQVLRFPLISWNQRGPGGTGINISGWQEIIC